MKNVLPTVVLAVLLPTLMAPEQPPCELCFPGTVSVQPGSYVVTLPPGARLQVTPAAVFPDDPPCDVCRVMCVGDSCDVDVDGGATIGVSGRDADRARLQSRQVKPRI